MITGKDKLSDVISRNIDLLPIIHRLGLSARMGEQNIDQICSLRKISAGFTLGILNTFSSPAYLPDPQDIEVEPLIEFLMKTHDYHKQVTIPRLNGLIRDLKVQLPGEKLPVVVEAYLHTYIEKLVRHIDYEESEIFPLVSNMTIIRGPAAVSNLKKLFRQHTNVEHEIGDLKTVIIRHIPEQYDLTLIHDLLHTLSHFEKEQLDHARFEDKILVPKLLALVAK